MAAANAFWPVFWMPSARPAQDDPACSATAVKARPLVLTEMITAAKSAGARVVVNGSDASDQTRAYLDVGADAVILGEPELTLLDLTARWTRDPKTELRRVPGAIRNAGVALSDRVGTPGTRRR